MQEKRALVLTGGGARGAYQVGVLRYIGEHYPEAHFDILVGSSAGAINTGILASLGGDIKVGSKVLGDWWSELNIEDVIRIDFFAMLKTGLRWLYDLTLGGILGRPSAHSLVDTTPLQKLLDRAFMPEGIERAVREKKICSVAITATEVFSGSSVTFVQGDHAKPWHRSRRRSESAALTSKHLYASAAIPFLFTPALIGKRQYVDGCVRATAPFGPAARLGATRIFAIGVRRMGDNPVSAPELEPTVAEPLPSPAQTASLVLNALFFDNLDSDAEHLIRINGLLQQFQNIKPGEELPQGMRPIDVRLVRPSEDLGVAAQAFRDRLPPVLRYLMRGLGASRSRSNDILSYLLFDSRYTRHLLELGYRDAERQKSEIEAFFGP